MQQERQRKYTQYIISGLYSIAQKNILYEIVNMTCVRIKGQKRDILLKAGKANECQEINVHLHGITNH